MCGCAAHTQKTNLSKIFGKIHRFSVAILLVERIKVFMRPVYVVSGGVSKFAKARPDKTFQGLVKEAYDYALADLGMDHPKFFELVDGSVASYFSDHFTRQLMAGIMAQDYLGLCPKPCHRVEGGGATGGICFQEGWKNGRLRLYGRLRGLRLRDHEPRRDLEGQRVHRPGLGHLLRLSGGRFLFRLLRHDGHPPHGGVRHHGGADGARVRQEPRQCLPQPLCPETRRA